MVRYCMLYMWGNQKNKTILKVCIFRISAPLQTKNHDLRKHITLKMPVNLSMMFND